MPIFTDVPEKGIHRYRLWDIAIIDVLFTVIAAFISSILFKWNLLIVLLVLFLLGILMHRIFKVRTTVDKWLFGS